MPAKFPAAIQTPRRSSVGRAGRENTGLLDDHSKCCQLRMETPWPRRALPDPAPTDSRRRLDVPFLR